MAGRVSLVALSLCLTVCVEPIRAETGTGDNISLVSYSFDDSLIETGPDTFRVFEHSKGIVSLTPAMSHSGYHSVQIQDVAHDGGFPELQGYFPTRHSGKLRFHFAFLVTDPSQSLNIALAGPQGFRLKRDGIGFWLSLQEGRLLHTSDSIPKPLLHASPFVWYVTDVVYDIGRGRYDLRIAEDSSSVPLMDLKDLANAANQPGSVVDKFSFVGDLGEDVSNVSYFVDEILLTADSGDAPMPYLAPGRRKLFIDRWKEYQRYLQAKLQCLPVAATEDFGLSHDWIRANAGEAAWRILYRALSGQQVSENLPPPLDGWRSGIESWHKGCRLLSGRKPDEALKAFEDAGRRLPAAPVVELSRIQALADLKRWSEVDAGLVGARIWQKDPRFGVALGQIGFARRDLKMLDEWWTLDVNAIPDGEFKTWSQEYFDGTFDVAKWERMVERKRFYVFLQHYVIAEQYFFVLLWRERHFEGIEYAKRMADHFSVLPKAQALWLERTGDAAFLAGRRGEAAEAYRASLSRFENNSGSLEKLSDLSYLAGDADKERQYREAVYGTLRK